MTKSRCGRAGRAWALAALALAGCGGPTVGAPTPNAGGGGTTTTGGGGTGTTEAGPSRPVDPAQAQAGREVYNRTCGTCHGAAGRDAGSGAPDLAGRNLTEERINRELHAGTDTEAIMPVIPPSQLPASDVPSLLAYLRSIHAMR